MLEMQKEQIRERINSVYGYAAISRIQFTQTAPTGFSEGQADFNHAPRRPAAPKPAQREAAAALAEGVTDPALRAALSRLGAHVIQKSERG